MRQMGDESGLERVRVVGSMPPESRGMRDVSPYEPRTATGRASLTTWLLACGIVAGPFYVALGVLQVLFRPGFDARYNALSQMALGNLGWIQEANFVVSGALVILGAAGLRRGISSGRARRALPILIGIYGAGVLLSAFFKADAGYGFPPGTPPGPGTLSTHGLVHLASSGVAFYALIAAAFVFAWRFKDFGDRQWSAASTAVGVFLLVAFIGTASGGGVPFLLGLWVAIFAAWAWLSALFWSARAQIQTCIEPRK